MFHLFDIPLLLKNLSYFKKYLTKYIFRSCRMINVPNDAPFIPLILLLHIFS